MKSSRIFISSLVNETVGVLLIAAAWSLGAAFYPAYVIPSPLAVLGGLPGFLTVEFTRHAAATFGRVLWGFALAFAAGSLLGGVAFARGWLKPLHSLMVALQVVPGAILGVIFLLMFGIGDATPVLLVAVMTVPTLAINTAQGLGSHNAALRQYLRTLPAGRWDVLRLVYLPALVPALQSNLSLGVSMAVKVVVLGEFIGSQDGLGFLLNNARILFNMQEVFFYLLALMAFTLAFQAAQALFFSLFFGKYAYPE